MQAMIYMGNKNLPLRFHMYTYFVISLQLIIRRTVDFKLHKFTGMYLNHAII